MKQYTLGSVDISKITKGGFIAMGGALLVYVGTIITKTNFGDYTPIVVAVGGIVVNTLLKILDGYKQ